MMAHSVYIMTKHSNDDMLLFHKNSGNLLWFKVGRSGDVEKRRDKIQERISDKVSVVAEYEFENKNRAHDIEQSIHKLLGGRARQGEWWLISYHTLKCLDDILVQCAGGQCYYYKKQWFILPEMSVSEKLDFCKVDIRKQGEIIF